MASAFNLRNIAAVSVLLLVATGTQASLIIDDGSGGMIPGKNERPNAVLGESTANQPAGYGANLYVDGPTTLDFTFVGKEAAFTNQFLINDTVEFENGVSQAGDTVSYTANQAGAVDFSFNVPDTNESVANGSNFDDNPNGGDPGEAVNFFVAEETGTKGSGIFLALDDKGGSDDDNHDDMVIEVQEVPAPTPLALLGIGLVGLGLRRHL